MRIRRVYMKIIGEVCCGECVELTTGVPGIEQDDIFMKCSDGSLVGESELVSLSNGTLFTIDNNTKVIPIKCYVQEE